MTETGLALFDTPIGACGVVWRGSRIAAVRLPGPDTAATLASLSRFHPEARKSTPPSPVLWAIDGMTALLAGGKVDLAAVELDLGGAPDFNRRVYEVARTIPAGETLTYGEVAGRLGERRAAQAVGRALGQNPVPIIVPCHRVLAAGGRSGGFSAPGGITTKMRILSIERARIGGPGLFDDLPLAVQPSQGRPISPARIEP